jgi:ketol-acid reductoisomerase
MLPANSASHSLAWQNGFITSCLEDPLWRNSLYALLIPDHLHYHFLTRYQNRFPKNSIIILAHAYSAVFEPLKLRPDLNLLLVAPKLNGLQLRQNFLAKKTTTMVIGASKSAALDLESSATQLAQDLSDNHTKLIHSTFAEECITNLFCEQALYCGGIPGLMLAAHKILIEQGVQPELADYECFQVSHYLTELISRYGVEGMYARISPIARIGGLRAKRYLIDQPMRQKLNFLFEEISNGSFANSLVVKDFIAQPISTVTT